MGSNLAKQRADAEAARQKHLDRQFTLAELREQRAMQREERQAKLQTEKAGLEAEKAQREARKDERAAALADAKVATQNAKTELFAADWEAHALMNAPIPGVGYTQVQKDAFREVLKQTVKDAA